MTKENFDKICDDFMKCIITPLKNVISENEYKGEDKELVKMSNWHRQRTNDDKAADFFEKNIKKNGTNIKECDYFELVEAIKNSVANDIGNNKINSGDIDDRFRKTLSAEFLIEINAFCGYKKIMCWDDKFHPYDTKYEIIKTTLSETVNMLDKFCEILTNYYILKNYNNFVKGFNSKVSKGMYSFDEWLLNKCDTSLKFRTTLYNSYLKNNIDKVGFYSGYLSIDRNLNTHDASIKIDFKNNEDVEKTVRNIIDEDTSAEIAELSKYEKDQIHDTKIALIFATLYAYIVYKEMIKLGYSGLMKILEKKYKKAFSPLDKLIAETKKDHKSSKAN